MTHEVVRMRGGGFAMRDTIVGEVMHPGVGPLVESEQLYVRQSRLAERLVEEGQGGVLRVFDIGLGAGSNAFAARRACERAGLNAARMELVSFERDLGALTLALDHREDFALDDESVTAGRTLLLDGHYETERTTWRLVTGELLETLPRERAQADIVFWDPFSPRNNPTLWTVSAFTVMRRVADPHCTLFTYSASTAVRIAMLLAGWVVGVGDAIGAKDETTAAACSPLDVVHPLDATWLERVRRADAPLPPDVDESPQEIAARLAALPQFAASARADIGADK